jgi:UDP-N-acetylmuramate--alanine ligase
MDMGISLERCSRALKEYKGVERRFQIIGTSRGITVIDDYAHNPAKVLSVLESLHSAALRILAIYQPHGFAPTRHCKNELIDTFVQGLRSSDILFMPEIYYAGGSVTRDISSKDLIDEIIKQKKNAFFIPERDKIIDRVAAIAKPDDVIIVMGARDPTLSEFAREIFEAMKRQNIKCRI